MMIETIGVIYAMIGAGLTIDRIIDIVAEVIR